MDSEELESRVEHIVSSLEDSKENPIVGGYVPPYIGKGEIKFVIIGQDPTVRNPKSREKVSCTLNLDKNGQLRAFVERICKELSVSMDNLYATNLFKYYWDYDSAIHYTGCSWKFVKSKDNALSSILYPLCHQPSLRKSLYKECLGDYLEYIRDIGPLAIGERAYDEIKLGLTHEMRLEDDEV